MERESPRLDYVQRLWVVLGVVLRVIDGITHGRGAVTREMPKTAARCPKNATPVYPTISRYSSVVRTVVKNIRPAATTPPPNAPRICLRLSVIAIPYFA